MLLFLVIITRAEMFLAAYISAIELYQRRQIFQIIKIHVYLNQSI